MVSRTDERRASATATTSVRDRLTSANTLSEIRVKRQISKFSEPLRDIIFLPQLGTWVRIRGHHTAHLSLTLVGQRP